MIVVLISQNLGTTVTYILLKIKLYHLYPCTCFVRGDGSEKQLHPLGQRFVGQHPNQMHQMSLRASADSSLHHSVPFS